MADLNEAKEALVYAIDDIVDELKGTPILCFSDTTNFRHDIWPSYKSKRGRKPLCYKALKAWALDTFESRIKPGLEADDVMGILATKKPGSSIIVTIDKDLKSIPGEHYHFKDKRRFSVTQEEADYWNLLQTLTGDQTDGYPGCPGIGPKKAEAVLQDDPSWAAVVRMYEKAKLTEADALVQARVARILRASDYNFKEREPILWSP